jgi:DNA mismatch endonuclease, patch repair protein
VDYRPLPHLNRRADLVFTRARVAVFVDGCYWHGCPEHARPSRTNVEFWGPKIARNKERDAEIDQILADAGWRVVREWEHVPPDVVAANVIDAVRSASRLSR